MMIHPDHQATVKHSAVTPTIVSLLLCFSSPVPEGLPPKALNTYVLCIVGGFCEGPVCKHI
jgi:hypothetical protein